MTSKYPFVLGVTGAIGSGKSLVGKMLEAQGLPVIDTDHLAHELLNSPCPAYDQVIARFGKDIVTTPGGPIDRKKLGSYVFRYERARAELEAIMHPAIAALQAERITSLSDQPIVAVLVPLLFESGSEHKYDQIWCVTINREVQMARLELRDQATREQIMQRINAQWAQERKAELSDVVIDNSFTKDDTLNQVVKALAATRATAAATSERVFTPPAAKSTTTPPADNGTAAEGSTDKVDDAQKGAPAADTSGPKDGSKDTTPPAADTTGPKDSKTDPTTNAGDAAATPDSDANSDENRRKNEFYRGILRDMAEVGSTEALDELGNIATTEHKEADATMSMVVKAGSGAPKAEGGTGTVTSERELKVDVRMTVRNRPGTPGSGNGCSCGCDNCKNGCACMADCGCGCKPPAPKPTPTPTPAPNPDPQPKPEPKPGKGGRRGFRRTLAVIALLGLLGFLGFLGYLAYQDHNPVVINNPTKIVIVKQPVVVNAPPVVVVNPPNNGGDGCIAMSGQTLSEPPAFSLPFLQNDVRWATSVWTVHYDDGSGYCRNSIVEGHDHLGRLTVRQFYGPNLDYRGQMTVKYYDDGTAQINRFDSYNVYQGRDSHRVPANEVR